MENDLLTRCHDAWLALEPFRRERLRCKRLSYGTDGASANNLVRQLLKSVVGRYRYLRVGSTVDLDADVRAELDLDARTLEEFLISGMAVNRRRLDPHHGRHEFANVSPERIFFTRCSEPDASDATLVGMLHDFSATQLLRQFGDDDPALCRDLMEHYRGRQAAYPAAPCVEAPMSWDTSTLPGHVRVIEAWEAVCVHTLYCHDLLQAELFTVPYTAEAQAAVDAVNARRRADRRPEVLTLLDNDDAWLHTWLSPAGRVLRRETVSRDAFPFALRLYPMTDGETHSLVADVAPQQLHINRLVALLDRVIDQSAKGVLLFPTEQLPDGFTWQDMRRIWANPGGIIPYKRTSRSLSPQQVNSTGWNQGAGEMLKLQLDLFAEVSGLAPSFRGREAAFAGSEAAKVDSQNASIALMDIMGAFHAFVAQRNQMTGKEGVAKSGESWRMHRGASLQY